MVSILSSAFTARASGVAAASYSSHSASGRAPPGPGCGPVTTGRGARALLSGCASRAIAGTSPPSASPRSWTTHSCNTRRSSPRAHPGTAWPSGTDASCARPCSCHRPELRPLRHVARRSAWRMNSNRPSSVAASMLHDSCVSAARRVRIARARLGYCIAAGCSSTHKNDRSETRTRVPRSHAWQARTRSDELQHPDSMPHAFSP